jgi:hypothetical protein
VGVRLWRVGSRRRRRGEELDGNIVRVLDVEVRPELVVLDPGVGDALLVEALLPAFELLATLTWKPTWSRPTRAGSKRSSGLVLACLRSRT